MTTVIRNRALQDDDRRVLGADEEIPAGEPVIVDWERWQGLLDAEADDGRHPNAGVLIPNTLDADEGWPLLSQRPVIALAFPAFGDGRAYSQARVLRQRCGFGGELRATGAAVVRDQIAGMARCGIDVFCLRDDQDPEGCLAAFDDFSTAYQAACDDVVPIWKRRRTGKAA